MGAAMGLEKFCFGAVSGCGRAAVGGLSLGLAGFAPAIAVFAGGVKGRNPSFDLARFPGVEFTRDSFGDMAGA